MAGTRTAPAVNGTPVSKLVSWRFIDVYGDIRTENFLVAGAITNAQIEALTEAVADGALASMWEVQVTDVYSGARLLSNADGVGRASADDKVFITLREPSLKVTKRLYVPSPVPAIFAPNSEQIDTTDALFIALTDALTPLLGTFVFSTVSFTERSETNVKQAL